MENKILHDVTYSANLTFPGSQIHLETNVCTANQKFHSFTEKKEKTLGTYRPASQTAAGKDGIPCIVDG